MRHILFGLIIGYTSYHAFGILFGILIGLILIALVYVHP